MSGQRRGRWPNIDTALGQCIIFAGRPRENLANRVIATTDISHLEWE